MGLKRFGSDSPTWASSVDHSQQRIVVEASAFVVEEEPHVLEARLSGHRTHRLSEPSLHLHCSWDLPCRDGCPSISISIAFGSPLYYSQGGHREYGRRILAVAWLESMILRSYWM